MSQSPPTTLGKYQIIREIARSNDIVYEAWDPLMNRRVAVKELAVPGGSSDKQREERLQRFHREARAAGGLVHPNIVTIYEVAQESGRHFIAMEYLDGRNLRQELDSGGALPPIRALEVAIEVLKGLAFSHGKGVVHRDIKPDNIQLLSSGAVKITDFGIARLTFEPNLTMDGQVFGTPSYMSPEQIHGRDIDARSDIFSVGVILYEMISGLKPFTGDSVVAITYSIMNSQPAQPPQASHSLWTAISRALDKSPQMRPASADEMRGMLEGVLHEIRSGSVVQAPMTTISFGTPGVMSGPPPVLMPHPASPPMAHPQTAYGQPVHTQQPYMPGGMPAAHQPGQVYQQPYVPGGGATGAIPAPSGGATPYNPYGQSVNLPQGIPVYIMPKPRPPLISVEAKQFLVKLLATLLILATVVGLAMVIISLSSRPQASGPAPAPASGGRAGGAAIVAAARSMESMRNASPAENLRDDIVAASRHWHAAADLAGAQTDSVRAQAAQAFIDLAVIRGNLGDSYGARLAAQHASSFAIGHPELLAEADALRAEFGG